MSIITGVNEDNFQEIEDYNDLVSDGWKWVTAVAIGILATVATISLLPLETVSLVIITYSYLTYIALDYLADYFRPYPSGINGIHLAEYTDHENNLPELEEEFRIENLYLFFDQINFTEPRKGDYINPHRIRDDSQSIHTQMLKSNLERLVEYIENRTQFMGVPRNRVEKEEFYLKLTKLLQHILLKIRETDTSLIDQFNSASDSPNPVEWQNQLNRRNKNNQALIDLGIGAGHCGGRVMTEAIAAYGRLCLEINPDPFVSRLKARLHLFREALILELVQRCSTSQAMHAHYVRRFTEIIGPTRGIFGGVAAAYDDPFNADIDANWAFRRFDERYNSENLIRSLMQSQPGDYYAFEELTDWVNANTPEGVDSSEFLYETIFDEDYKMTREGAEYILRKLNIIK